MDNKQNGLTHKQQRFCDEYMIDLNATQAAIRSGYSKKTASRIGQENLYKPVIAQEIKRRQDELAKKAEITQEMIIRELARVAFSDLGDYLVYDSDGNVIPHPSDKVDTAPISAVTSKPGAFGHEFKFKLHDKIAALKLLGQHIGMFTDRVEHSGDVNCRIQFVNDIPDDISDDGHGTSGG